MAVARFALTDEGVIEMTVTQQCSPSGTRTRTEEIGTVPLPSNPAGRKNLQQVLLQLLPEVFNAGQATRSQEMKELLG